MNANGRRCRQFKNGFKHLARLGRPIYHSASGLTVAQSIQRERAHAARQAAMKGKKK